MTDEEKTAGGEDTFISHLVELRDRLMKAAIAIVAVFLCMMPWSSNIYDLLAQPMMAALPSGSKMIATGVITPFLIPIKVTLLAAFIAADQAREPVLGMARIGFGHTAFGMRAQHLGAKHRHQGQRDNRRYQDGDGECNRPRHP